MPKIIDFGDLLRGWSGPVFWGPKPVKSGQKPVFLAVLRHFWRVWDGSGPGGLKSSKITIFRDFRESMIFIDFYRPYNTTYLITLCMFITL